MRMAGRFIAKAKMLQRQRTNLPGMEITGVELSGDLARLLPIESSLIAGRGAGARVLALARSRARSLSYKRILRDAGGDGADRRQRRRVGLDDGERSKRRRGSRSRWPRSRARRSGRSCSARSGTPTIRTASGDAPTRSSSGSKSFIRNGGTDLDGPLHTLPTRRGRRSDRREGGSHHHHRRRRWARERLATDAERVTQAERVRWARARWCEAFHRARGTDDPVLHAATRARRQELDRELVALDRLTAPLTAPPPPP
jgi:hypothetical protein